MKIDIGLILFPDAFASKMQTSLRKKGHQKATKLFVWRLDFFRIERECEDPDMLDCLKA